MPEGIRTGIGPQAFHSALSRVAVGSGLAPSNNEKRKQKTKVILLEPESQTAGPMLAGPPPELIRDRGCWTLCQACWARHICSVQRVPGWKERSELRAGACGCRDPRPNPPPSLHPPQQHPLEGLLLWQLTWGTLPGLSPCCEQSPRTAGPRGREQHR